MIRGAQWIAANSRHTKSLVEMWGLPAGKIKIVYPPISEEATSARVAPARTRGKSDELQLVTICRLVRPKGVDTVLRAIKILDTKGIPFRYVIGGDGVGEKAPGDSCR